MHAAVESVRHFLAEYGYWAIACFLLLENAGVPVPGESILILASAASLGAHKLQLPWIIVVGTVAATTGDNLGYWIGRKGGRALLERWKNLFRISRASIDAGEMLLERHGVGAIFFARFVAGARIFAGPLAGILKMHWPRFAVANFCGAVVWVTVIATLGHLFGSQLDRLLQLIERTNWITLAILAAVVLFLLWRKRRRTR